MSGPKAFRVVTRAEIIAICRRNLARLDATVEAWKSACLRNATITQADADKVVARRDEIHRLLDAGRYVDLQKEVAAEISYLQADAERRAEKAAQAEARSKLDLRRAKTAAQALLARLESSGRDVPAAIRGQLTATSASLSDLNTAISRGLMLLAPAESNEGTTERQREIAGRLGAGERRISLDDWLSQQAGEVEDRTLLRVDVLLGELKGLGVDPIPFNSRISALEAEVPSRRSLVADSLLLDLTSAVRKEREWVKILSDLRSRRAELSDMKSPEAVALRSEIDAELAGTPTGTALELIKRADFLIEAEVNAMAAEERRRIVLQGLASLGYEVSEGMATAWVKGGRVVLRKTANPGYGVELSGGTQSDLLQVRAVGIASAAEVRDSARDKDMETIWCGEFERLQALVAKNGGSLSLESARPVGQFPLKVVQDPTASPDTEDIRTQPRFLGR